MTTLLRKRLLAFLVDYLVIAFYGATLFWIAMVFFGLSGKSPIMNDPVKGQLIGFFTLTLPVFLYFFLAEKSKWKATLGKRKLNIQVSASVTNPAKSILIRNIIKFLPWEIAHTGVHWVIYYSNNSNDTPVWVWTILLLPQLIMVCYAISIIVNKGRSGFYDKIAGTEIMTSK